MLRVWLTQVSQMLLKRYPCINRHVNMHSVNHSCNVSSSHRKYHCLGDEVEHLNWLPCRNTELNKRTSKKLWYKLQVLRDSTKVLWCWVNGDIPWQGALPKPIQNGAEPSRHQEGLNDFHWIPTLFLHLQVRLESVNRRRKSSYWSLHVNDAFFCISEVSHLGAIPSKAQVGVWLHTLSPQRS